MVDGIAIHYTLGWAQWDTQIYRAMSHRQGGTASNAERTGLQLAAEHLGTGMPRLIPMHLSFLSPMPLPQMRGVFAASFLKQG